MSDYLTSVEVPLIERAYWIRIGQGLLGDAASIIGQHLARVSHAVVVADQQVIQPHAKTVVASLNTANIRTDLIAIASGESSKSVDVLCRLWQDLLNAKTDRSSVIIAIGGGVIGDLAGFAAASFVRGIRLVQIPTTLLSQVDSSVGGKTGINLPGAKNMIGAFWQPSLVIADLATFQTLPEREFKSGLAEIVKYGVILDSNLFEYLEQNVNAILARDPEVLAKLVARSCQLKAQVVVEDERETTGRRAILNYGHTFGHAIEAATGYGQWLHGEAVAAGMVLASETAFRMDRVPAEVTQRQIDLLQKLNLPTKCPSIAPQRLWQLMQNDKKVQHGKLSFVLPDSIGHVDLVPGVPQETVESAITAHQ